MSSGPSALSRVVSVLGSLLAVAIVSRVAYELMKPLIPGLVLILALVAIYSWLFRRY